MHLFIRYHEQAVHAIDDRDVDAHQDGANDELAQDDGESSEYCLNCPTNTERLR